jgi:hypothetical protein
VQTYFATIFIGTGFGDCQRMVVPLFYPQVSGKYIKRKIEEDDEYKN